MRTVSVSESKRAGRVEKALETLRPEDRDWAARFLDWKEASGVGEARLKKYASQFGTLSELLGVPFNVATEADIDRFALNLKRSDYSESTKRDFKIHLKLLFKFAEGNKRVFPEKVQLLDTSRIQPAKINPNTLIDWSDAQLLIEATPSVCEKAVIAVLWETGARVGEILSMRIRDVQRNTKGTLVRLEGKTGERLFPLYEPRAVSRLETWLENHPSKGDLNAPLWLNYRGQPLEYRAFTKHIKSLAKKTGFSKPLNPHFWRKSAASRYATKLSEATVKKLFGWTADSSMLKTYQFIGTETLQDELMKIHGTPAVAKFGDKKTQDLVSRVLATPELAEFISKQIRNYEVARDYQEQEVLRLAKEASELGILPENELLLRAPGGKGKKVPKTGESEDSKG